MYLSKTRAVPLLILALLLAACSSPTPSPSPSPKSTPTPTLAPTPKGVPSPVANFLPNADQVDALIGESFTFEVSFANALGSAPGYGPFIDIAMDSRGVSNDTPGGPIVPPAPCDGIFFTSAQMVDVTPSLTITNTQAPTSDPCSNTSPVSVPHPYGSPVTLPAAMWQMNTLTLPFGSFDATQPTVVVEVTAFLSQYANINEPLQICIRGGFQGSDEHLNDVTTNPLSNNVADWSCKSINPVVLMVNKTYLGPESEAASGPNLSSLGMAGYQLTVDIAAGQTVDGLLIQDVLPNSLQYVAGSATVIQPAGWALTTSSCSSATNQISLSPPSGSGGSLSFQLCSSLTGSPLTGTPPDADVQLTFLTFVPQPVLGSDCAFVPVWNKVTATGKWQPLDPRDGGGQPVPPVSASLLITAKCLAVQKSVVDQTHPGQTVPGDILEYTITFQVSDYFTIGQLMVTDVLADGQSFVAGQVPTLTVGDGTLLPAPLTTFPSGTVTVKPDETATCTAGPPDHEQTVVGATVLTFDVSQAMGSMYLTGSRLNQGILTGGLAASPSSTIPATGTITFYAQVDDQFAYPHLGIDPAATDRSVNKLDPINNCVSMTGGVYDNQSPVTTVPNPSIPGVTATDTSASQLIIAAGKFTKTIVAQNGVLGIVNAYDGLPTFAADDLITFELKYDSVPSSDAQRFTITDWLPRPVLEVLPAFSTSFPACSPPTLIPSVNTACYVFPTLATGTVFTPPTPLTSPTLTFSSYLDHNSLTFDFGTFHNLSNPPSQIIVRFTMKLTNTPYADLLHLTNVAQECEGNAIQPETTKFCQVAVAPFVLSEPALRIRKGVIKTGTTTAVFDPARPLPSPFPPTVANPVTGVNLNNFFNSNVTGGVDAGDSLIFAIVVENYGSGLHGAFDVEVTDTLPPGLTYHPSSIAVTYGDGQPITPIYPNGQPTPSGFDLILPNKSPTQGSLDADANASGPSSDPQSLAIITFGADIADTITPTCPLTNGAQITAYAADKGGPSFVLPDHLGGPLSDDAWVCIAPTLAKSIVTTSEPVTPVGSPEPLTIGEIVRYRLQISLPEANYPGFTITDQLPAGLSYLPGSTTNIAFVTKLPKNITNTTIPWSPATIDGDETSIAGIVPVYPFPTNHVSGDPFDCSTPGADPTFDLGAFVNPPDNPEVEFIVLEFNAIVCNITDNHDQVTLDNTFEVNVAGANPPTYSSNSVSATIVEPKLTVTKEAMPGVTSTSVGAYLGYKITLTNIGDTAAFDVVLSDTYSFALPTSTSITAIPDDGCSVQGTQVFCNYIPANSTPVTIIYWITVTADHVKIPDCTTTNTGTVTWTSLPGEGTPVGAVRNLTGSSAGSSGSPGGERTGAGDPLNDYHQSYSFTIPVDNSPTINCPPPPPAKVDLAITKTLLSPSLVMGSSASYQLLVTNVGPTDVGTTITVTDTLDPGLTYTSVTQSPLLPAWVCDPPPNGNVVHCTFSGGLAAGDPLPAIIVTVEVLSEVASPPITNCADVSVATDGDLSNNHYCITDPVSIPPPAAKVDLAITKTLLSPSLVTGSPSSYQLLVTNVGPTDVGTTITVTDTLDPGLTYTSVTQSPLLPAWVCDPPPNGNVVHCTFSGGLAAGDQLPAIIVGVELLPQSPGPPSITNCADVSVYNEDDLSDNHSCVITTFSY